MSRPIVAFLTDFGTRDHYVGTMKGALLSVCRDATIVDISHDVPPQDVVAGAIELAAAYRYFPSGTIFVAVVDPGVGSERRAIAVESGEYRFLAPDNGLLTIVLGHVPPTRIVEVNNPVLLRGQMSRTFEGRDRFAPAAGWLGIGIPLKSLGSTLSDYQRIVVPQPVVEANAVRGVVLRVDRFGTLISNLDRATVEQFAGGGKLSVEIAGQLVGGVVNTYSDAEESALCALFGSSDHLEVAVRNGNAAERLVARRGVDVVVRRA